MQIYFSVRDVGSSIFYENMSIETIKVLFESTQNKKQYDSNIAKSE